MKFMMDDRLRCYLVATNAESLPTGKRPHTSTARATLYFNGEPIGTVWETKTYSASFEVPDHGRLKFQSWEFTAGNNSEIRRITAPTKLLLSERCDAFLAVYDAEILKK